MVYPALIAAAAVLGTLATRPLGVVADLEGWLYRLLVGFGLCAVLAIGLGSYSLSLAATALYLIAALGLLWELRDARTRSRSAAGGETASRVALRLFDYACLAAIAGSLLLALISALAPVTSWDASVAHLALPAAYAREGRMIVLPGNVYSGYPHLLYSLYAIAYASAGEQAVTLLNWTFAALACLAVYVLGKRIEGPRCGLAAAALLATAPVFMDQAGEVAIDLGFTALTTASLAALVAWFEGARHGHAASDSSPLLQPSPQPSPSGRGSSVLPGRGFAPLVLSAALAGSACGVRHTGFLVCLLLGVGVLAGSRGARLRATALFSGIAVLAALPWLLRSALTVGNPVFPLLPSLFPTQGIEHVDLMALGGHESVRAAGGTGLVAFLRFPWDIIMRPHLYDGWTKSPGSVVLALGVPGLILGGRRARTLGAFSVAGGVFLFFIQRCARCLLPFFTPMMVVAAVMTNRAQWMRKGVAALLVFAFAYGLALHAVAIHVKIPVFLGGQTREAHLRDRIERYPVFEYANKYLDDGAIILTPDPRVYYLNGPTFQNHGAMLDLARLETERQLDWLRARGIRYVLIPWAFLDESDTLRSALVPMFRQWRADTARFRLIREFVLPRAALGSGEDRVDLLEFVDGA